MTRGRGSGGIHNQTVFPCGGDEPAAFYYRRDKRQWKMTMGKTVLLKYIASSIQNEILTMNWHECWERVILCILPDLLAHNLVFFGACGAKNTHF
jgi:hypothetical protein